MTQEEIILNAVNKIAETTTSMHFHEQGLMNHEVNARQWSNYFDMVRNAILDVTCKYQN